MIENQDDETGAARPPVAREGATLPRDVQEHLGRRLRTALHVEEKKPDFLGDSNIPPQFEPYLRRLEAGERGERQGYEAVKRALDFGLDSSEPDGTR